MMNNKRGIGTEILDNPIYQTLNWKNCVNGWLQWTSAQMENEGGGGIKPPARVRENIRAADKKKTDKRVDR